MPYHPLASSAQHAQDETQTIASQRGYAWREGCAVTLGSSSSSIETDVDAGMVLFNGKLVDIAQTTLTHDAGDATNPRWDAIVVSDSAGTLSIVKGPPNPPAETPDGTVLRGEEAWSPAPADTLGNDIVILAFVWIPSGATITSDLTDTGNGGVSDPIVDRRYPSLADALQQTRTATITSSGWYRIAQNGPVESGGTGGDRAGALFSVRDTQSALHSYCTFYASYHYGNNPTLTLLNDSYYGGTDGAITGIRMPTAGTTEGAAVEIHVELQGQTEVDHVEYTIYDNTHVSGWEPIDFEPHTFPSGFNNTQIDLDGDTVMAAARLDNTSFKIDGDGGVHTTTLDREEVGIRAVCSSDFTLDPANAVKMPIDDSVYDDWGALDAANNEIIIPSDGTYLITAQMGFQGGNVDVGDNPQIRINRNGGTQAVNWVAASSGNFLTMDVTDHARCNAGDAISSWGNISNDTANVRRYQPWTFLAVAKLG